MKKCILWIEDFDNKSSTKVRKKSQTEERKSEKYDKYLRVYDELYKDLIEIKTTMLEGLEYIKKHYGEFDCVILDVNLNNNLQQIDKDDSNWKFLIDNINLKYVEDIEAEFRKYGGFYIVLLLITLGFPKGRIIILTAYGGSYDKDDYKPVKEWCEKFSMASIHIPHIIEKGNYFNDNVDGKKHKKLNEYLKKLYHDDAYYYTRLFLYKLYNIIYKLNEVGVNDSFRNNDLLFNKICKNNNKRVKLSYVNDLINNAIDFFPFVKPVNTDNIFFNTLKYFSEPFEADYNVKNGKVLDDTYRVIKTFRNWASHNLIEDKNKLKPDLFRLLFFVEFLLFTRSENCDTCELLDISKEFFLCEKEKNINIVDYIKDINWEICKKWDDVPKDMIGVYDRRGRIGNKMKLIYLIYIYINCSIDINIVYANLSLYTEYAISDRYKTGMNEILLKYAIELCDEYMDYVNEH